MDILNNLEQTQPAADYFVGTWDVKVKGTPQGDAKLVMAMERKDGKLSGYQFVKEKTDTIKFTKVEEKDKSITAYYTTQGFDVYIKLEKKDDDHVIGSLMGMFDATAERIKDTKSK